MRLLKLQIHEPLPGRVLPQMAREHGAEEAARRYRAIAVTTLRQLRWLTMTRIRIMPTPEDADEALRFWLLPRLAPRWQAEDGVYRADGWEIDFGSAGNGFIVEASGEVMCPFLCARWVHTAMIGIENGKHRVTGPATEGGEYFHAHPASAGGYLEERRLPALPVIRCGSHWQDALDSPLGAALKKAWEAEA